MITVQESPVLVTTVVTLSTFAFYYSVLRALSGRQRNRTAVLIGQFSIARTGQNTALKTAARIDWLVRKVGYRVVRPKARERLTEHLTAVGITDPDALDRMIFRKTGTASAGALVGTLFMQQSSLLVFVGLIAGFYLPDLLLHDKAQKRAEIVSRDLPDAIDLLDMCLESGLTFEGALAKVVQHMDGPVPEEFARLQGELEVGKSRIESLTSMAKRNESQGLNRLVSALVQADRMGVPVSSVLREQAKEARAARRQQMRERAQKIPVKILLPVMVCFLPGLFIVILGPAVIQIARALGGL